MPGHEAHQPLDEERILAKLDVLNPAPAEEPDVAVALVNMRRRLANESKVTHHSGIWRWIVSRKPMSRGWWAPAVAGILVVLLLGVLFSFASVRQAAADFLSIFRVQKIAVVPISPSQWEAQQDRLEDLAGRLEQGFLGQPDILREAGEPQRVSSAEEASRLAGFRVRMPGYVPDGSALKEFSVSAGPAVRYAVDRAMAQSTLEMLGITDISLPEVEKLVVTADIPAVVLQEYRVPLGGGKETRFTIYQVLSPSATVEPAVDPALFGELALRAMGVPADEAHRLAASIDWTSTLVIPVPTNLASFREVAVDGGAGILLEEIGQGAEEPMRTLIWQKGTVMYVAAGRLRGSELLRIAESLR